MIRGQEYDSHTQLSMLVILIQNFFGLADFDLLVVGSGRVSDESG